MEQTLRVNDLLESKHLRGISRVVAGDNGLNKLVGWVHILEIRDIVKECVDGNEMVLTTGIGFTSKDVAIKFLQELINQNVTALCIETALYYHIIDQELIDLANEHNFPLIEINVISRFVDITKGLNTMILNKESKLYHSADNYDLRLSEIESKGTIEDGIKYTSEYLNIEVAFFPEGGHHFSTASELGEGAFVRILELKERLKNDEIYTKGKIAIKHLELYGRSIGYLLFNSKQNDINQFDLLILGRLSNKIKEDISRELLKKEEKLYKNIAWIKAWMDGSLTKAQIVRMLSDVGITGNFKEFMVCSIEIQMCDTLIEPFHFNDEATDVPRVDEFLLHNTLVVKMAFEEQNFRILGFIDKKIVSYIVLSEENVGTSLERIEKVVDWLRKLDNPFINYGNAVFAVGKLGKSYMDVNQSYITSLELLADKELIEGKQLIIYDNLYIGRILKGISRYVLEEYIRDYLKELLDPDNTELLQTLKIYYESNCSKQKTAEKLFIVRQTLYFRLKKIEDILGYDYESGAKRFAVEFAVNAYYFLKIGTHR